jgi:NAD(P)H-dependent FMN reductase/ketosteroid isomerase-like protein
VAVASATSVALLVRLLRRMAKSLRVVVLVGSLRSESYSRKLAHALIERAPKSLACEIVEIGELPLYNEDLDQGSPPAPWLQFRTQLRSADAVLFVTPEYNRSIPGCLKNALDVGSRPPNESVFDGVPAAVASVTPYKLGAFGANHALRQTFVFLNMPVMQQPELYIGKIGEALDAEGKVKDPETSTLLDKFMGSFESWVTRIRRGEHDFEEFLSSRRQIARDYVNGDPASLGAIATRSDPATFLPPRGGSVQGAEAIATRYASDAKSFHPGGRTQLEVLHSGTSGDLAFWTGFQRAEARMGDGGSDTVKMTLRVTEVFRFEDGGYKLVHRHADTLAEPKN